MSENTPGTEQFESVDAGEFVYTEDGDVLGVVDGFTDRGVEVVPADADEVDESTESDGPDTASREEEPGQAFGEGYLMWRCDECGEMGGLEDGLPDECPACGAPKTALFRTKED